MSSPRSIAFVALCLAACNAPAEPSESASGQAPTVEAVAHAPRAWTDGFMESAVLVAREVSVEGPAGLLEHLALQVDPEQHEYRVETTAEGLLQELSFKANGSGRVLRAQLDQLVIAAETRIRVLERPGDVAVVVTAMGNASWTSTAGAEKRGERLRLTGEGSR